MQQILGIFQVVLCFFCYMCQTPQSLLKLAGHHVLIILKALHS